MQNTAGIMTTAPLDLLFGLVGQPPTRGPADAAQFAQLLGVFGLGQAGRTASVGDSGSPIEKLDMIPGRGVSIYPEIPLLLGADLAETIGLVAGTAPQIIGQAEPNYGESAVLARAQILPADGANGEALLLKVMPGITDNTELPVLPGSDSNQEEMILPIRLRTVEQSGSRIIAEGLLQTAAGKDVSIRLNLDLAGQTNQIQLPVSDQPESIQSPFKATAPGEGASLPQLLGQLDVKSLVIETVNENPSRVLENAFPETATAIRSLVGSRTEISGRPAIPLGPQAAVTGEPAATVVPNVVRSGAPAYNPAQPKIDGRSSEQPVESYNSHQDAMIETTTVDSLQPAVTPANSLPTEISATELTTDAKGDLTQVRYLDLDLRLDQLKQNPGQRIKIQLVPSHLGKMELSIVNHRGIVAVNLTVDSPQAKQAVERNLAQLERQLSASGIRVDTFHLEVSQSAKNSSLAQQYQYFQSQQRNGGYPQQNGRGDYQHLSAQKQMSRFGSSSLSFAQTMVNCLA